MENSDFAVSVQNLTRAFGGLLAVKNVSFEVPAGQIRGLIGPNGAGKTTVLNILSGLLKPTSGDIFVFDKRVTKLPGYAISRMGVARTFQQVRVLDQLTALENVLWALIRKTNYGWVDTLLQSPRYLRAERENHERAEGLLEYVGILEYKDCLASDLPYGMQRRLELARALALEPKILLLDEPTAGLNTEEALGFAKWVEKLCEEWDLTLILVEHNMKVVMSVCRYITVMNEGEIICEGSPSEVQRNERVIEAYLGRGQHAN